jgi:multidrug transporter EmrE-like cation transporter
MMSASTLALILVSVSLSALAQVSFKLGMSTVATGTTGAAGIERILQILLSPGVLGGLALYGIGTMLWLTVLGRVQVSQAYPFVGLGFVLTALMGYAIFGDTLGVVRILGILSIIGGIALVAHG